MKKYSIFCNSNVAEIINFNLIALQRYKKQVTNVLLMRAFCLIKITKFD
jgi:hypothetical protein